MRALLTFEFSQSLSRSIPSHSPSKFLKERIKISLGKCSCTIVRYLLSNTQDEHQGCDTKNENFGRTAKVARPGNFINNTIRIRRFGGIGSLLNVRYIFLDGDFIVAISISFHTNLAESINKVFKLEFLIEDKVICPF